MKVYAIIPSGGTGKRINTPLPKQYIKFSGKELIAYTLEIFQKNTNVNKIVIPAQKEYFNLLNGIIDKYKLNKVSKIVEGGKDRQHSVQNALESIDAKDDDLIIVHDAVRPLLPPSILNNAIETAKIYGNVIVAIKAKDTLIKGSDTVTEYIDRNEIYYVQTPQIFPCKNLRKAFDNAKKEGFIGTDESMLVTKAGFSVKIVEGSSINFKVTDKSDIELLHKILN